MADWTKMVHLALDVTPKPVTVFALSPCRLSVQSFIELGTAREIYGLSVAET